MRKMILCLVMVFGCVGPSDVNFSSETAAETVPRDAVSWVKWSCDVDPTGKYCAPALGVCQAPLIKSFCEGTPIDGGGTEHFCCVAADDTECCLTCLDRPDTDDGANISCFGLECHSGILWGSHY